MLSIKFYGPDDEDEAEAWLEEHEDEIDPVLDDEINGDDVVSLESLEDTDDEPYCDPFGTEDYSSNDDDNDDTDND